MIIMEILPSKYSSKNALHLKQIQRIAYLLGTQSRIVLSLTISNQD